MAKRYEFLSKDDHLAKEIGHIVMQWGMIEDILDDFIQELSSIDDDQLGDVIAGNMDIRSKLSCIKGLASIRSSAQSHIDSVWLDAMVQVLDFIDNELRPKRNLIVHAHWFMPTKTRASAITKKTKLLRPQAFQRVLETRQSTPLKITEMRKLCHTMLDVWFDLLHLFWYSMRPFPPDVDEHGKKVPLLTLRRYLQAVGYTLRAARIAPEPKRQIARQPSQPKKPSP